MEGDSRFDWTDFKLVEGAEGSCDRGFSGLCVDDELADHRIVVWGDAVSGGDMGVDADSEASGGAVGFDESGAGAEVLGVVLGVDAALDRVAFDLDVFLLVGELLSRGDLDGGFNDVHACDHLGDRVLDLDSGVDLEHVEVLVVVHQELDGRGSGVVGGLDEFRGGVADLLDFFAFDERAGSFFDDFLVAALHRAIAFPEMDGVAVLVADALDFDVSCVFEEFFDEDSAVPEGGEGFLLSFGDIGAEGGFVAADAHASTTAACGRFDDDGVPDLGGDFDGFVEFFDLAFGAWEDGDFGGACVAFGFDFVAELAHRFWGWSDELDLAVAADLGEIGSFREESISGVDRVNIGDLGGGDDAGDVEVGVFRWAWTDADGFVGELEVGRVFVCGGVDADGLDLELLTSAHDSEGDLASVCDEDALEHGVVSWVSIGCWLRLDLKLDQSSIRVRSGFDHEECLSELDGVAVFHADLGDRAGLLCFDLVEDFHGFDEADDGVIADGVSDIGEDRGVGVWFGVVGADHWGFDGDESGIGWVCWNFGGGRGC